MPPTPAALPSFPRLVLRAGFAGTQRLPADHSALSASLLSVFEAIARRVSEIAPGTSLNAPVPEPQIRKFYSKEVPLFRLITGLCEGADSLGAETIEQVHNNEQLRGMIATELAAVIPFDLKTYRSSRPESFLHDFDQQAQRCAYILELDGHYEKPAQDTALAKHRRSRAYRAQSTLLLRHSDLLIAATDAGDSALAGGTFETVRAALHFEIPVVFINTDTGQISMIQPGDDPGTATAVLDSDAESWQDTLGRWITNIVADPEIDLATSGTEHSMSHGEKLLTEYFGDHTTPPYIHNSDGELARVTTVRERCWMYVEKVFQPAFKLINDPRIEAYGHWRIRSSDLARHYTGLYRGMFLHNYALAAIAVMLAAFSLILLGKSHTDTSEAVQSLVTVSQPESKALVGSDLLFIILLLLAAAKLTCVFWIFKNTRQAHKGDWNDKAVDFRYLTERLRTMYYLPRIGSFQPPTASPPQYASRVVRQSAVDWLFEAIVRTVSPATMDFAEKCTVPLGRDSCTVTLLRVDPGRVLTQVQNIWVKQQAIYHDRNARTMDRLRAFAENWGRVFNFAVIIVVGMDLTILVGGLLGLLPDTWSHFLHGAAPWLVFIAAILPAVVASLNGVRFQSECRRLAERSAVVRAILRGRDPSSKVHVAEGLWPRCCAFFHTLVPRYSKHKEVSPEPAGGKWADANRLAKRIATAKADPARDPASWTPEVLQLTESVAHVFVQEVAEWSVLYAKEVPEP